MGAAIATQIATTAVGLGDGAPFVLAAGLAVFAAVAGVQLPRFRRPNGVWLGGFASRVVLRNRDRRAATFALALGAAIWAANDARWWLVANLVRRRRRRVRAERPPVDAHYRAGPGPRARRIVRVARGARRRRIGGLALLLTQR